MPTALPLTFCEAVARRDRVEHLGIANDAGLAIVVAFAAVGLALTIGLVMFFPYAANAIALAWEIA